MNTLKCSTDQECHRSSKTDVYQSPNEKADRKHPEYGLALALICVALAIVLASAMFGLTPSEFPLDGP
jgi:hypothetical protein